jgi:hypothetical protein
LIESEVGFCSDFALHGPRRGFDTLASIRYATQPKPLLNRRRLTEPCCVEFSATQPTALRLFQKNNHPKIPMIEIIV